MTDFSVEVISSDTIARARLILNSLSISEEDVIDFTDDNNIFNAINAKVNMAMVEAPKGRHDITSESLSQKWLISLEAARRTVQHTTQ